MSGEPRADVEKLRDAARATVLYEPGTTLVHFEEGPILRRLEDAAWERRYLKNTIDREWVVDGSVNDAYVRSLSDGMPQTYRLVEPGVEPAWRPDPEMEAERAQVEEPALVLGWQAAELRRSPQPAPPPWSLGPAGTHGEVVIRVVMSAPLTEDELEALLEEVDDAGWLRDAKYAAAQYATVERAVVEVTNVADVRHVREG